MCAMRGFLTRQDLPRNDEPLDLARALVDLRDLRVAVVALDGKLLRVAVPAEDLHRFGRLPPRDLGREELRLRTLRLVRQAAVLEPCRAIREETRRVDLDRHVDELRLDRLVVGDALAERPALLRVRDGDVVCGLRDAERLGRDADPAAVEGR